MSFELENLSSVTVANGYIELDVKENVEYFISKAFIEKKVEEGRTFTRVTSLEHHDRIREIARIIGGDIITQTTLKSAEEMIEFAKDETNSL